MFQTRIHQCHPRDGGDAGRLRFLGWKRRIIRRPVSDDREVSESKGIPPCVAPRSHEEDQYPGGHGENQPMPATSPTAPLLNARPGRDVPHRRKGALQSFS